MADEYATAYADAPTNGSTPRAGATTPTPPDNPKPGLWAYVPFDAPVQAQYVNDLAVKTLLMEPLQKLDEGLKQARYRVKAAAFAAQALLFRDPSS